MTYRIGIECGQRWWRPRSWSHRPLWRTFSNGVAFGPIMVFRDVNKKEGVTE